MSNLELKIRAVKGEIRENERKKKKCLESIVTLVSSFLFSIIGSVWFFVIKKERDIKAIILAVLLLLGIPILYLFVYSKYKKVKAKMEQLERELYLLKKGLKEE